MNENQKKVAETAHLLLSAFADVGITALVDEATGFQKLKDENKNMGYKIGYCEKCGYPQILSFDDCAAMMDDVTTQTEKAVKALAKLQPRVPIKEKLREWALEKLKT